jgi:DNA gyrase subunit B
LFRVRKGKRDLYMKDQGALDRHLIQHGTEGLTLRSNDGRELSGTPVLNLAGRLRTMRSLFARLERRCDSRVAVALLQAGNEPFTRFDSESALQEMAGPVQKFLEQRYPALCPLTVVAEWKAETQRGAINVKFRPGATARLGRFDADLAESHDYRELVSIEQDIRSIGSGPYLAVSEKSEPVPIPDALALDAYIEERGRKGVLISRYKGLGEMNASELWETTMNPDGRTLLQVRVEDPVRADELFSILMGDQVEPRRNFIEQNALSVRNLDI